MPQWAKTDEGFIAPEADFSFLSELRWALKYGLYRLQKNSVLYQGTTLIGP